MDLKTAKVKFDQSGLTKVHKKILDQRLAAQKVNPQAGSSWKEVKQRIKAKL